MAETGTSAICYDVLCYLYPNAAIDHQVGVGNANGPEVESVTFYPRATETFYQEVAVGTEIFHEVAVVMVNVSVPWEEVQGTVIFFFLQK